MNERLNLVTGGTGFLGRHLVKALLDRGERVRTLVRKTSNVDYLAELGAELFYGDIDNLESLKKAVSGVEYIYNSMGVVKDWGPLKEFKKVNVQGVENLLKAVTYGNIKKFVHISSVVVYGIRNAPADEKTRYRYCGIPYPDTKIDGEKLVWRYHKEKGLPVTIVRPGLIYGPECEHFVREIIRLLESEYFVFVARGNRRTGLAYVDNVVDLILLAADSEKSLGQAYNAEDNLDITWKDYIMKLAAIAGITPVENYASYGLCYSYAYIAEKLYKLLGINARPYPNRLMIKFMGIDQFYSIEKAARELGYRPRIGFDEGMNKIEEHLKSKSLI
ncbi:MAG: NAD-dependent epimerase/dehydratase family protein [Spirochaetes bacterium]|nr:NAD-dependent epimerase/dehydratase family protein [Spirochaetota bacterium]